jgi:adenylosuccinate lyase
MAAIWSDEVKYDHWLRIEILAAEARANRGEVPQEDIETIKGRASFDARRIEELEKKTRHDVAAFLDNLAETIGPAARHLHYGMTSSDVLDTTLALQCRDASELVLEGLTNLIRTTIELARKHSATVMAARTHGIQAELTTLGIKTAGWAFELDRGRQRLERAKEQVSVGKLSGVVGTYSQLPPEIEDEVCRALGLEPDPSSTQVVSRDRHAELVAALAILAGTIERIATEIRHLARTEVRELEEPFAEGEQKGSSAMPHKRNPWRSERLVGLARVVRSSVIAAIENIALWHERDISHSSVERTLLPDAFYAVDFMIGELTDILEGLVVYPDRMRENIDRSFGLVFSQRLLLDLVDAGLERDEAYRLVQEAATESWKTGVHLKEVVAKKSEMTRALSSEKISRSFEESRYLEHADELIGRLSKLESPLQSPSEPGRPRE